MPRTTERGRSSSYFGVSPWQSNEDFDRVSYGDSEGVAQPRDVKSGRELSPKRELSFCPANVLETVEGSAECILFVDKDGSISGHFADDDDRVRSITGKFLRIAQEYGEYLDCGRDSSWDILLLCLHDMDNMPLFVVAEAQGGDSVTIEAPVDLTSEERYALAGYVGSLTLSTGFTLRFDCRELINADIDDKGLVRRQLVESASMMAVGFGVPLMNKLETRTSLSHICIGSLTLANTTC